MNKGKFMALVFVLFPLLFLGACKNPHAPEIEHTTLRIQGAVTDATNSSLIAGAVVRLKYYYMDDDFNCHFTTRAEVGTNHQGYYYMLYRDEERCYESKFHLEVQASGYIGKSTWGTGLRIACTHEVQTFNFQLKRY